PGVIRDGMSRLCQCLVFFAKARISPGEVAWQLSRIDRDNRVGRWFHGRNCAHESTASFVVFSSELLAVSEQRHSAWIIRNGRWRVVLDVNNRILEASLVVELQCPCDGDALVL